MKLAVIPILIGALGTISKGLVKGLEDLEIRGPVEPIQIASLIKSVKSLEDLRRLVVTQTPEKDHQFILFTQPLRSGTIWHKVNF